MPFDASQSAAYTLSQLAVSEYSLKSNRFEVLVDHHLVSRADVEACVESRAEQGEGAAMLREYEYAGVHLLPQRMIGLRQDDEQVSEEVEVGHEFEGEHAADDRPAALNGEYRVERLIETEA